MRATRWAILAILGAGLVIGCSQQRPEQEAEDVLEPPPPARVSEDARQRYQKLYPDAQIGRVIATLPEARLVSVTDVPVSEFRVGDVLTFVGAEGPGLTGDVVAVVSETLHVRYSQPEAGQRAPIVGDLAVRFQTPNR